MDGQFSEKCKNLCIIIIIIIIIITVAGN